MGERPVESQTFLSPASSADNVSVIGKLPDESSEKTIEVAYIEYSSYSEATITGSSNDLTRSGSNQSLERIDEVSKSESGSGDVFDGSGDEKDETPKLVREKTVQERFVSAVRSKLLPAIRLKLNAEFNMKWAALNQVDEQRKAELEKLYTVFHNVNQLPENLASMIEPIAFFEFSSGEYRVGSDKSQIYIDIRRSGGVRHPIQVEWATREDSALPGQHFQYKEGLIDFMPGERTKRIYVDLDHREVSKSAFFIIEMTGFNNLLWELPEGSAETGTNYEAKIEMISKVDFAKMTNQRIEKPDGLEISHNKAANLHVARWDLPNDDPSKNFVCEYEVQYRQANNKNDEVEKIRVSGLDPDVCIEGKDLEPEAAYNLRVVAIDFANQQEQTEWTPFSTSKATPLPPSVFTYDKSNKSFSWDEVDCSTHDSSSIFEIGYAPAEDAKPEDVSFLAEIDIAKTEISVDNIDESKDYIACIRVQNESGWGYSQILQIAKKEED